MTAPAVTDATIAAAATGTVVASSAPASAFPRHVAIIMDGNGRWAKARHLPRLAGHRQGAEAVRKTLRAAAEIGIEVLTLYAFSSENWRRPASEVDDLMGLLRHYLRAELDEIHEQGVRLQLIGDWRAFGADLVEMLEAAVARTAGNTRLTLVVALNYGARAELVGAAQRLAAAGATIDEASLGAALDTAHLPDLDLLIRTSGEVRLSNFLLWQAAYAELLFVDTLWPDFDGGALRSACETFAARTRRFGGL